MERVPLASETAPPHEIAPTDSDPGAAQRDEERFRQLFYGHTAVMLLVAPQSGHIVDANPAAERFYGYARDELLGLPLSEISLLDPRALATAREHARTRTRSQFVVPHRLANGDIRLVEAYVSPVTTAGGPLLFAIIHDVTEQVTAEDALRALIERQRLAASVFTHAHEGVIICDPEERILDVNPMFTQLTGYTREEVLGRTPRVLSSRRHGVTFFRGVWRAVATDGRWEGEVWNRRKDGEAFIVHLAITAVRDDTGSLTHYIGHLSDITQLKHNEERLERLAHHDALTGLPNRTLLADRLEQALARSRRTGSTLAVGYLDLDRFKPINDLYGHDIGDQLLIDVAARLRGVIRAVDTVARLGGDEFVVLFADLKGVDECEALAQRVLDAVAAPDAIRGEPVRVTASLGLALFPDDGATPDALLRHADLAMYSAKEHGRNRFHCFEHGSETPVLGHRRERDRLRRALDDGQFVLYYQPKVNLRRGEVVGFEALVRWEHPERGLLGPASFLPAFNACRLDATLGRWVLRTALAQRSRWFDAGFRVRIAVNIAGAHLLSPSFAEELGEMLASHSGLCRGCLELEIIESTALVDLDRATAVIEACHELGVTVALDDFGTGYSSLSYLRRLPVDTVKLDQEFVRAMSGGPNDVTIVKSVVGLAQAFGRELVAEGVETAELAALLVELGCDVAQGFGIARPMPAAAVPGWLAAFRPDPDWLCGIPAGSEPGD